MNYHTNNRSKLLEQMQAILTKTDTPPHFGRRLTLKETLVVAEALRLVMDILSVRHTEL